MRFTNALKRYPRLEQIKDFIIDYFKLYQRAYGMFHVDYDNFNKAVDTITSNTEEYFDSKQEDEDIRVKREKLRKYEGLIPFLENVNEMISEYAGLQFRQIFQTGVRGDFRGWSALGAHLMRNYWLPRWRRKLI